MVGSAKSKVEAIEEQLKSARIDFEATQDAAFKGNFPIFLKLNEN